MMMYMNDDMLYRFTPDALKYLYVNCSKYLDTYRNPDANFEKILQNAGFTNYREPVSVRFTRSLKLDIPNRVIPRYAELGAIEFYNVLEGMSPRLATDPSLLAYINHFYLHKYGLKRWNVSDDDKKAVKNIHQHWFSYDGKFRSICEQNLAGRTWWIAHTSLMAAHASNGMLASEQILEMFVHTAEYYHRTMQSELLSNYNIMAECLLALFNANSQLGMNSQISTGQYLEMLAAVNREAGGKLLDALERSDLREIVTRVANDTYALDSNRE